MFLIREPGQDIVQAFLDGQRDRPFSCADIGATRNGAPAGFNVDHNRARLGETRATFERAKIAVRRWKMFAMPWISLYSPGAVIEVGSTVAVMVSHLGFYSLNAARIVYVIDEPDRFGFAYGTLPDHSEIGEERFLVEMLPDGSIWYDLFAFSRPRGLAKLAYPLARRLQRRFAVDSMRAMQTAVSAG